MKIFAIESSCDETSAAVVDEKFKVLALVISSQIKIHKKYFGVVPELASRAHIQNINFVIKKALNEAGLDFKEGKKFKAFAEQIDAIAYTCGPGLAGALLVGAVCARTLSSVYQKPLIAVNHLEGHLYSSFLKHKNIRPPFLALLISGGHTEMILVKDFGKYIKLGATRDDACGEAFDKAAKMLELSYPGGPEIDKHAQKGDPFAIKFTRPFLKGTYDFSFSGIKTALLNYLSKNPVKNQKHLNDICASFRQAIVETLVFKAFGACRDFKLKSMVLGGGVCNNLLVREMFYKTAKKEGVKIFMPAPLYCQDNAAMIAAAAFFKLKKTNACKTYDLLINPSLQII